MRLKVRFMKVHLYRIAAVVLVCSVTGCVQQSSFFPTYMQPELLYLNDPPYSRLYIEVDTVEGVDVPDQWLDEMKTFLGKYCSKPDGIEIVRDAPIPLSEVKGTPIGAAKILCLDGPDPNSDSQCAYLHVFFFDKNVGLTYERVGACISGYCPSGVFFNDSYTRSSDSKAKVLELKQALGFVLGLCRNSKSIYGQVNCENQACLMSKNPGFLPEFGLLHGSRVEDLLCADCRNDIETLKSLPPDPKLSFRGPFLVRHEEGYSIASLPYCDVIILNSVESTFDWMALLSFIKNETHEKLEFALNKIQKARDRKRIVHWFIMAFWDGSGDKGFSSMKATEDTIALLRKAAGDPSPNVKRYAIITLKKLKKEQKR